MKKRRIRQALCAVMCVMTLGLAACDNGGQSSGGTSSAADSSQVQSGVAAIPQDTDNGGLDTVGLYVWEDSPDQHAFWKACGITTLQFCDRGWFYNSESYSLDAYLKRMQQGLYSAKDAGFDVYVILFSNIEQYKGPEETEPTGLGVKFHPDDKEKMKDRLYYLEKMIKTMDEADGFTFFAGDPGGITDAMGEGDVEDYIYMAEEVGKLVKEAAPNAKYNINTWAVSMFETPNYSAMIPEFWLRETEMNKVILGREGLINESTGLELPCHDYYRPLVLRLYADSGKTPALKYPQKSDIDVLKSRNTQRLWAWPYFLLDEADDGDAGADYTYLQQIETRYIHQYLNNVRELGFNGVIGSWSYNAFKTKSLNTYAFGRMANDKTATPEQVIDEYAGYLATADTCQILGQILRFVENDSNFEKKLPDNEKIAPLETTIKTAQEALDQLAAVKPNTDNAFPLPMNAEEYLHNLKGRLELMK